MIILSGSVIEAAIVLVVGELGVSLLDRGVRASVITRGRLRLISNVKVGGEIEVLVLGVRLVQ